MTAAVSATSATAPPQTAYSPASSATPEGALLPDAPPTSCADLNDALSALYAMLSQLRTDGMENGRTDVGILKEQQDKAIADMRDAIARRAAAEANSGGGLFSCIAHFFEDAVGDLTSGKFDKAIQDATKDVEAAWNSPAFWSDLEQGLLIVAKVGATVGAAAATVVTAGAAGGTLLAVALVLSAGGMAVSETGCLDGLMGRGWSTNIGLAMELGGTAMTMGATFASAATGGLKVVGQAGAVASVTGGVATAGAGAAHVRVGDFQADAQSASADAVADTQSSARLSRFIEDVIEAMKDGEQSAERQGESIVGCEQTNEQTQAAAAPGPVR